MSSKLETLMSLADALEGKAIAANNEGYGQDDATWARCFARSIAFQDAAELTRVYARRVQEQQP